MKDRLNKIVENKLGRLNSRALTWDYVFRQDPSLRELIDTSKSVQDVYYEFNLGEAPLCPTCKVNKVKPTKYKGNFSFSQYCSVECSNNNFEHRSQIGKKIQSSVDQEKANEKRKATMLEKYGVAYNSQRQDVKIKLGESKLTKEKISLMTNKEWFVDNYINSEHTLLSLQQEVGIDKGTIHHYLRQNGLEGKQGYRTSRGQIELKEYIESLGFTCILNDRSVLGKREIDIYVPEKNFGIEYDGLYYHSHDCEPDEESRLNHQKKVLDSRNNGCFLIRFLDCEWETKTHIVKSIIKENLGISSKVIQAKDCVIREIPKEEAKQFIEKTHLQGFDDAKISIGLFHENELVLVTTFGEPRFDKEVDYELTRFSSELDTIVVKGLQKCLDYFRNKYQGSIVTYSDCRYSDGKIYELSGFEYQGITQPNSYWTDKRKLLQLTEQENMFDNGYRIYYDCGSLKFIHK